MRYRTNAVFSQLSGNVESIKSACQAPKTVQRKDELGVALIKVEIRDDTGWVKLIAHLRTLGGPGCHSDWARDWYKNVLCLSTGSEWQEVSGR
jgi:hypothetical protein